MASRFRVSATTSLVAFAIIGSASLVGTSALVFERLNGNDSMKDIKLGKETFSLLKLDAAKMMPDTTRTNNKQKSNPRAADLEKMK